MTNVIKQKNQRRLRRAHRTRSKIRGNSAQPRVSVFRSLRHLSVQVIDDAQQKTLASSSDMAVEAKGKKPLEVAALIGADVAEKAIAAGVKKVVFDRGSYKYHGRVKAIAEAMREGGLEF